jgi:hypothetical protein
MKAYLITTGALFALLALIHLLLTITHWSSLTDARFILQGPGIGVVAAILSFWAWRLFRASPRS